MRIKAGQSGKGSRKYGRNKRKKLIRSEPLSLLVRGKILPEDYFRKTGIRSPFK